MTAPSPTVRNPEWLVCGEHPAVLLSGCMAQELGFRVAWVRSPDPKHGELGWESPDLGVFVRYAPGIFPQVGSSERPGLIRRVLSAIHLNGLSNQIGVEGLTPNSSLRFNFGDEAKDDLQVWEWTRESGVAPKKANTWVRLLNQEAEVIRLYWLGLPDRLTLVAPASGTPSSLSEGLASRFSGLFSSWKQWVAELQEQGKDASLHALSKDPIVQKTQGQLQLLSALFRGSPAPVGQRPHDLATSLCLSQGLGIWEGDYSEGLGLTSKGFVEQMRKRLPMGELSQVEGASGVVFDEAFLGAMANKDLLKEGISEPDAWWCSFSLRVSARGESSGLPEGWADIQILERVGLEVAVPERNSAGKWPLWVETFSKKQIAWLKSGERILLCHLPIKWENHTLNEDFVEGKMTEVSRLLKRRFGLRYIDEGPQGVPSSLREQASRYSEWKTLGAIPAVGRLYLSTGVGTRFSSQNRGLLSNVSYPELGKLGWFVGAIECLATLAHRRGILGPLPLSERKDQGSTASLKNKEKA